MVKETWSIEYNEIENFLNEEGFVKKTIDTFCKESLCIHIIESKKKVLGALSLPSTTFVLEGNDEDLLSFQEKFKKNFLRSGG